MRKNILRYKELKMQEIPQWGHYLREQWCGNFASHLSTEEQNSIGMDGFFGIYAAGKKLVV